jgi:hypothetical protein
MKALSLRQPWAWLVVHGGKSIENRRWNTSFRGEFLIHAAKGMTRDEYAKALAFALDMNVSPSVMSAFPLFDELERGGIVGRARLVDVLPPCLPDFCPHPWHMRGQFGFVLADVRAVTFKPMRGMLSFFEPNPRPVFQGGAIVGWAS